MLKEGVNEAKMRLLSSYYRETLAHRLINIHLENDWALLLFALHKMIPHKIYDILNENAEFLFITSTQDYTIKYHRLH